MSAKYLALPTNHVRDIQNGGPDANGQPAEVRHADNFRVPCRHCFQDVEPGQPYLTLAYSPFSTRNPYTETGPLFIHADACEPAQPSSTPPTLLQNENYVVRGYNADERIVYGSGTVTPKEEVNACVEKVFTNPEVAFIHIRSAEDTCFQCRVERD